MKIAKISRKAPQDSDATRPAGRSMRALEPHLRRLSLASQIARKLEEEIVLGRRHPRERLVEQDLCEQFRTHRGDVRLALFELERKGIVHRIPNRGAMVRDLSPDEVSSIYDVREELEVMAMRILPLPVPPKALAVLEKLQRRHSDAVDAGDSLAVHYGNVQFHRALFGLCGNPCLIETIEHLAQRVSSIRSYAHAHAGALANSRRDHAEMIAALRDRRRDDLITLARRHLKPAVEAYILAYRQRFGGAGGDRRGSSRSADARTAQLAHRRAVARTT